MAAKRITKSAINWAALAERVPENQKSNFQVFKSKSDVYMRNVLANPENPPAIDWAYYQKLIPNTALVDSFKKQYEAFKVPYPADKITPQIEQQIKDTQVDIEAFKSASADRIAKHETDIAHLQSIVPYDQMTMEDYRDSFPEKALDPINRPTFWPHAPEDQLDYKDKDAPPAAH